MRLVSGPTLRAGCFSAVTAAFPVPLDAVLSDPRPRAVEVEEREDARDEDEVNPLASRCFCASASCDLNFFCRLLNVSC